MKNRSLTKPSPALVISMLALFVALGGAGYAATALPKDSVGTAQIKNKAVTAPKLHIDLTWKKPTLTNSWAYGGSDTSEPAYTKDPDGIVHLRGSVAGGMSDTVAFTLPPGYRPAAISLFPVYADENTTDSLYIGADGKVYPLGDDVQYFTSLDGVSFPAG